MVLLINIETMCIMNEEVLRIETKYLLLVIRKGQLKFCKHTMKKEGLVNSTPTGHIESKRSRGKQPVMLWIEEHVIKIQVLQKKTRGSCG